MKSKSGKNRYYPAWLMSEISKIHTIGLFNHLLSNMFRQYDKSHHQAFKIIVKDNKRYFNRNSELQQYRNLK